MLEYYENGSLDDQFGSQLYNLGLFIVITGNAIQTYVDPTNQVNQKIDPIQLNIIVVHNHKTNHQRNGEERNVIYEHHQ